jgi:RNA polymerase sigma-70 factor (ECF subfamily)
LNSVAAALQELPAQCREAFLLNRLEGLTHSEIAERLGVSTKTVQRHIERALRRCVQVLE